MQPAKGMGDLTERELLILMNEKVAHIDKALSDLSSTNFDLRLRVRELETKAKFYAAGISAAVSVIVSVIVFFITKAH